MSLFLSYDGTRRRRFEVSFVRACLYIISAKRLELFMYSLATLSFSGAIALQPILDMMPNPAMVITPIVNNSYTVRLMGEGFEAFDVTAMS